jgi:hypothetical protein
MTCQECELRLATDQNVDENVDQHLFVCAACRALAAELHANALTFEALAEDPLPPVRHRVMSKIQSRSATRQVARWGWALGALAAGLSAIFWNLTRPERPAHTSAVVNETAVLTAPHTEMSPVVPLEPVPIERIPVRRVRHAESAGVLKVKMFTSDPDVVIYWLVEKKEGTE